MKIKNNSNCYVLARYFCNVLFLIGSQHHRFSCSGSRQVPYHLKTPNKGRSPRTWLISCEEFRELRHSAFLTQKRCAEFLGVGLRTVQLWDQGKNRVPWSVVRLLRIVRLGDLGGLDDAWAGWTINRNGLWSPTGKKYDPDGMAKWWMVSEQARFFRDAYDRGLFGGVGAPAPAVACEAVPLIEDDQHREAVNVAVRVILDALPSRVTALLALEHRVLSTQALVLEASGDAQCTSGGGVNMVSECNHIDQLPCSKSLISGFTLVGLVESPAAVAGPDTNRGQKPSRGRKS